MRNIYMVEFDVPVPMTAEFVSMIPAQRKKMEQMLTEQKLLSYSLSMNRTSLWVIGAAKSENELMELLADLPLTKFMHFEYHELMFHHAPWMMLPTPSLN